MHIRKQMVIAYATEPLKSEMTSSPTPHQQLAMQTDKNPDHSELIDDNSASCKTKYNSALKVALKAEHDNIYNLVDDEH